MAGYWIIVNRVYSHGRTKTSVLRRDRSESVSRQVFAEIRRRVLSGESGRRGLIVLVNPARRDVETVDASRAARERHQALGTGHQQSQASRHQGTEASRGSAVMVPGAFTRHELDEEEEAAR